MRYAPWVAAAVVVVLASVAVGVVLWSGSPFRTARPAEMWGTAPAGSSGEPAVSAAGPGTATAPVPAGGAGRPRAAIYVAEQVSPIVAANRTLNESLGIESPRGRFRAVLPRGTEVQYARSVVFSTAADDQKEIRLHVLRGQSESASDNRSLGWVRVVDLPPGPKGATRVSVTFQIMDGAIVLVARNTADGRPLPIEASEPPPGFGP